MRPPLPRDFGLLYYSIIKDRICIRSQESEIRRQSLLLLIQLSPEVAKTPGFISYITDLMRHVYYQPAVMQIPGTFCPLSSDLCHLIVVEVNGIEPMTSCVQGRRSPS